MNLRLIQARKDKGLTQEQVAAKTGIDRSTYAHYERGRMPGLETALKISQALDKSVEEIFMPINVLKQHITPTGTG
ncbi:MAG: helix-turn-helix transcriptional regulator [Bacillota bacterium]